MPCGNAGLFLLHKNLKGELYMAETTDKNVVIDESKKVEPKPPVADVTEPVKPETVADSKSQPEKPEQAEKTTPAQETETAKKESGEKDTPDSKQGGKESKVEVKPKTDKSKSDKATPAPKSDATRKTEPQTGKGATKEKDATDKKVVPDKQEPTAPTVPLPEPEKVPPENVAPEPEPPRDANRINEKEAIVYIAHADLHPFKNHPFQVRDDDDMKNLVTSIKERGVDQAAIVRPRESGGYEIVAGHRRQFASEQAGILNVPCIVRNMTDDEAILAMTESNFNQRSEMLASERAKALKMQLDAIKRQGERFKGLAQGDVGKRSNEIVADRNKMSVKNVQRYISLNNLAPDLMKLVDEKKVPFTAAVEMSYIGRKNQQYIAVNIESQDSSPSLTQTQRMRELDKLGQLLPDVIDGIMLEEKKEELKVIITGQELSKYFGVEKSPKEMKDTILKLLDEYKAKQPPELNTPSKNKDAQEK